jgi:hypothetical protein
MYSHNHNKNKIVFKINTEVYNISNNRGVLGYTNANTLSLVGKLKDIIFVTANTILLRTSDITHTPAVHHKPTNPRKRQTPNEP